MIYYLDLDVKNLTLLYEKQQRSRLACTSAKSDQSLCFKLHCLYQNCKILASLFS